MEDESGRMNEEGNRHEAVGNRVQYRVMSVEESSGSYDGKRCWGEIAAITL
jgi:hypothetical protein